MGLRMAMRPPGSGHQPPRTGRDRRVRFLAVLLSTALLVTGCSSDVPAASAASPSSARSTGSGAQPTPGTQPSGHPTPSDVPAPSDVPTPSGEPTPSDIPTPSGTPPPSGQPTPAPGDGGFGPDVTFDPQTEPAASAHGTLRLMAGGDVMLARTVGSRMKQNPKAPFAGVTNILEKADLVIVNLECTISTRGKRAAKTFAFRASPLAAKVLKNAHVDIVSQANNHGMDYGKVAMADARAYLAEQGIDVIGAGRNAAQARAPVIVDQNGLRVAFLAYLGFFNDSGGWSAYNWEAGPDTPGLALARKKEIRADVKSAKNDADVVVVYYHAGEALETTPNDWQRAITNVALDAGASLVISTHPHILQGTRRAGKTFVAYSIGNFVFDGSRNSANDSVILDVTLSKAGVDSVRLIPVLMVDAFPERARGADAARIKRRLAPV